SPPTHSRFKKGQSGNCKGRPRSRKSDSTGVAALLSEPVKVKADGKVRDMSPFEASLRKLAKKAVDGHLPSILKFIRICEEYSVIAPPQTDPGGGVIVGPKGVDFHEWLESVTELVPADELQDRE